MFRDLKKILQSKLVNVRKEMTDVEGEGTSTNRMVMD